MDHMGQSMSRKRLNEKDEVSDVESMAKRPRPTPSITMVEVLRRQREKIRAVERFERSRGSRRTEDTSERRVEVAGRVLRKKILVREADKVVARLKACQRVPPKTSIQSVNTPSTPSAKQKPISPSPPKRFNAPPTLASLPLTRSPSTNPFLEPVQGRPVFGSSSDSLPKFTLQCSGLHGSHHRLPDYPFDKPESATQPDGAERSKPPVLRIGFAQLNPMGTMYTKVDTCRQGIERGGFASPRGAESSSTGLLKAKTEQTISIGAIQESVQVWGYEINGGGFPMLRAGTTSFIDLLQAGQAVNANTNAIEMDTARKTPTIPGFSVLPNPDRCTPSPQAMEPLHLSAPIIRTIAKHLHDTSSLRTLAALQSSSRDIYDTTTPYLYKSLPITTSGAHTLFSSFNDIRWKTADDISIIQHDLATRIARGENLPILSSNAALRLWQNLRHTTSLHIHQLPNSLDCDAFLDIAEILHIRHRTATLPLPNLVDIYLHPSALRTIEWLSHEHFHDLLPDHSFFNALKFACAPTKLIINAPGSSVVIPPERKDLWARTWNEGRVKNARAGCRTRWRAVGMEVMYRVRSLRGVRVDIVDDVLEFEGRVEGAWRRDEGREKRWEGLKCRVGLGEGWMLREEKWVGVEAGDEEGQLKVKFEGRSCFVEHGVSGQQVSAMSS